MTTPANPDDLITFLHQQLDEDEAWAERVITAEVQEARAAGVDLTRDEFLTDGGGDWQRWVLAEVDAKRRILDEAERYSPELEHGDNGEWAFDSVLRLLALPFADRPGYREEWRP